MTFRALFAAGAATLAVGIAACSPAAPDGRTAYELEGDRAKGSVDAPVTIIEYASVACGGCAAFHNLGAQAIYEGVDNGDVRFVFREMITGEPNIAIAGFMLANCAADDQYFDVIDLLFEQQPALFAARQQGRGRQQYQTIARSVGFSDEEFNACINDQEGLAAVQERNEAAAAAGIRSTPTFIINGETLESGRDGSGALVYTVNSQPLTDELGPIPATFERETFERIIAYYKARAEDGATDGGAE